jgi:SepF-like predicted cell division protein (DUF552 family)
MTSIAKTGHYPVDLRFYYAKVEETRIDFVTRESDITTKRNQDIAASAAALAFHQEESNRLAEQQKEQARKLCRDTENAAIEECKRKCAEARNAVVATIQDIDNTLEAASRGDMVVAKNERTNIESECDRALRKLRDDFWEMTQKTRTDLANGVFEPERKCNRKRGCAKKPSEPPTRILDNKRSSSSDHTPGNKRVGSICFTENAGDSSDGSSDTEQDEESESTECSKRRVSEPGGSTEESDSDEKPIYAHVLQWSAQ